MGVDMAEGGRITGPRHHLAMRREPGMRIRQAAWTERERLHSSPEGYWVEDEGQPRARGLS